MPDLKPPRRGAPALLQLRCEPAWLAAVRARLAGRLGLSSYVAGLIEADARARGVALPPRTRGPDPLETAGK